MRRIYSGRFRNEAVSGQSPGRTRGSATTNGSSGEDVGVIYTQPRSPTLKLVQCCECTTNVWLVTVADYSRPRIAPAIAEDCPILVVLLWPSYGIRQAIMFLPCGFFFYLLFSFLVYSQPSQIGCLPYLHTWCGLSANLGCRSETCCTRLAEMQDAKKSLNIRHLAPSHKFVGLYLRN